MANSFLEFTPIITLMGVILQQSFLKPIPPLKTLSKTTKEFKITLQDELFYDFH